MYTVKVHVSMFPASSSTGKISLESAFIPGVVPKASGMENEY